jgi:O-acetyl-ADP-ribose deacetylase (regulator of RNase III)
MTKTKSIYPINERKFELAQGSITNYVSDAIVCPANGDLEMVAFPGGLQYAIFSEGGPTIFEEAQRLAKRYELEHGNSYNNGLEGRVPVFSAHITSGGRLPAKNVIHSVSVDYSPAGGLFCDKNVIQKSTENVLKKCDDFGIKSVGFPTLGTGLYRVPIEESALVIAKTSAKHLEKRTALEKVGLVVYRESDSFIVKQVLDELFSK